MDVGVDGHRLLGPLSLGGKKEGNPSAGGAKGRAEAVLEARMPSLSSFLPRLKPGASVGTRNALIPLFFRERSVVANTMAASALWALAGRPPVRPPVGGSPLNPILPPAGGPVDKDARAAPLPPVIAEHRVCFCER